MSVEEKQKLGAEAANLLNQGKLIEAQQLYEQVCSIDKDDAHALTKLAAINGMLNKPDKAIEYSKRAITLLPNSIEARTNLANALLQTNHPADAAEQFEAVLKLDPNSVVAWFRLGQCQAILDRLDEAIISYKKTLQLDAQNAPASHGLGYTLLRQKNWVEAIVHFRHALSINPQMAQAHFGLGSSLQMLGNLQEALVHHQQAITLNPVHVDAQIGAGTVLSLIGKPELAIDRFREAIRLKPDNINAYTSLAATLFFLEKPEEALRQVDEVLKIDPGNVEAISLATTIDHYTGNNTRAHERLKQLIKAKVNNVNVALSYASICNSLDEPGKGIALIEKLLSQEKEQTASARRALNFSLGKLYNSKKSYDKAFEHYRQGNSLKETEYDHPGRLDLVNTLITMHTPEYIKSAPHATIESDRPVFVVGMARSGTSLIEQILASHPSVFGAGELPDIIQMVGSIQEITGTTRPFPYCLPELTQNNIDQLAQRYLDKISGLSSDSLRVVDKMPGNFMHLGLIKQLFPNARIIHSMRDPMDTCLSCYFQDFSRSHHYSYDLPTLGAFYKSYLQMMQHWREVLPVPMLEIQYEELVADQETVSRRMLEFCGLDWDKQCADFHETRRYVATASYDQVRRPMYTSSVSRWKNYEKFLGPLRDALN